jgi:hypothetical protein
MREFIISVVIFLVFAVAPAVGWCRCVYKMCVCNWEPVGKAEIFYTVGTFTGAGIVIGYIDIKDK